VRRLQRENVHIARTGRGWKEGWEGIVGHRDVEALYVPEHDYDSRLRLWVHSVIVSRPVPAPNAVILVHDRSQVIHEIYPWVVVSERIHASSV